MKLKNKYYKLTHISERKFREILKYFCEDLTATKAASLSGVSRNSVNKIYGLLRERIAYESITNTPELGEFEVDESYFGAKRVRGKRGRGAAGKTPVFGILKRGGHVYVNVVKHCSKEQLMPIIQGKALEGSTAADLERPKEELISELQQATKKDKEILTAWGYPVGLINAQIRWRTEQYRAALA